MSNPYESLPPRAFWRTGVADPAPLEIAGLWTPKHHLTPDERIITAGSCFAQHIGRALAERGYRWFDAEPGPSEFETETLRKFGYGVFSFRTGNIYTVSLLQQWIEWAFGVAAPSDEVWEKDGRFYDPFRPAIEPEGFESAEEMFLARKATYAAIRRGFRRCNVFVFTLGLTEAWINRETGVVYPMCPGTVAGTFDADIHQFVNYGFPEIFGKLSEVLELLKTENPDIRFLLTVSPVPLTATASGQHVLTATTYSKSTLRAVAGSMAAARSDTDYFPSYEIITGAPFRGMFYEDNLRSVKRGGVDFVMSSFFRCLEETFGEKIAPPAEARRSEAREKTSEAEDDVVCEEVLLEAFGER